MNAATLINQASGKVEFWTPQPIIEAARKTMGWIDLDPASCFEANQRVKAESFFTEADDGLSKLWHGNVWMNHPFSREYNAKWINKLVGAYKVGNVAQACCITFASTSEAWFRPLMDYPQCFLSPRTNYITPDGKVFRGVTKGSVVTYMGQWLGAFRSHFKGLGVVKL